MSDGLRDELADVYARWAEAPFEPADWQRQNGYQLADELLPVVRRYAAWELRQAALKFETDEAIVDALADQARVNLDLMTEAANAITASTLREVVKRLSARADAVEATA